MKELKQRIDEELNDYRMIENPPFPQNMLLEVTNICNHSCLFCANSKMTRKKGMINQKLAKRILDEAYQNGTRDVGFYATGEPLVNPDLETYIQYAKDLGYEYTYLTTNGALFTQERMKKVIEAGIDSIKFSINASTADEYKMIHGNDDFEKVIDNLKLLWKIRQDNNYKYKIYVSYIKTCYTENDTELIEKIKDYSDDIIVSSCINQGGGMQEINKYLISEKDASDDYLWKRKMICPIIFNCLYVSYEGYLTMCCADFQNYLAVADLNKESIENAWINEYAKKLRKKHIEHKLEGTLCFNCLHNCRSDIEPLCNELATICNMNSWDKSKEIENRINNYLLAHEKREQL